MTTKPKTADKTRRGNSLTQWFETERKRFAEWFRREYGREPDYLRLGDCASWAAWESAKLDRRVRRARAIKKEAACTETP